jgi:DNA-binding transcriptional MocR family regulator
VCYNAGMVEPRSFKVSARLIDFMRQADERGLINLAAGVPGLDSLPTEELCEAFTRSFVDEGAAMFAYHHPEGDHALREHLAERLRKRGANVTGKQLLTVTGCTQGLHVMLSLLVKPGEVVAVEAPGYYGMLELLSILGARVLPLRVRGGDGVDPAEVEEAFARWRPKCFVICSALSNPSGATIPEANRARLVQVCQRLGVRIIEDDIYGELLDGGALRPMLAYDDGATVSYVSSFSKTVAPGLRVGVCAPGTLFEDAAALKCREDLHSSVVSEVALREFLESGALDSHLDRLRARNRRRREIALEIIARTFPKGTTITPPRGGYMLWVELPQPIDLAKARAAALAQHVAFAAGTVFFTNEPTTGCLRLNCAKAGEDELVRGLEILGGVLAAA